MRLRRFGCVSLIAASLTVGALPGEAQAAESFSEAQLRAYAVAAYKVTETLESWRRELKVAQGDPELRERTREQINRELVTLIRRTDGITVETYQRVSWAARDDEQLYDRIDTLVERIREKRSDETGTRQGNR